MGFADRCSVYPTAIIWDQQMGDCFFGDHHPMHPSRLDATARLAQELGIFDLANVQVETAYIADDAQLSLAHSPTYIRQVKELSTNPELLIPDCGIGTEDTPAYRGIHEASARLAGGSLLAAQLLLDQKVSHAVNFSGGMHHAHRDKASGFCIYNDCAVAIQHLLDSGVQKIAYVDVDAHHGDGTQSIFWDEPRVMTISLHESGMSLFPGTGFANESGPEGQGSGSAVNIALPASTSDGAWIRAFDAVVPPLLGQFQPEIIVSQHGCDTHAHDEQSHLSMSIEAQREIAAYISVLADRLCEGRWLATGGGGYSIYDAVPRSWSHLMALAAGSPLDLELATPGSWQTYMKDKYGTAVPTRMGDGADLWWYSWEVGFDPADEVDRSVMATRKEIFPLWGLDPWYD